MNIKLTDYNKITKVIGNASIAKFEEDCKEFREKDKCTVIEVDLSDAKIEKKMHKELAELKVKYNIEYVLAGIRESDINRYVDTYYFLKRDMNGEDYQEWILDKIKMSKERYMVYDNRFTEDATLPESSIIRLGKIDDNKLLYERLRTYYTQPNHLTKHLKEKGEEGIWVQEYVYLTDLSKYEVGIRFPCTNTERTIVMMIKQIIESETHELE